MEPKKVTVKILEKILEDLAEGSEGAIGNYLFKDFRIQISKYKATGNERYMRLYKKRREQGLCIRCGAKVKKRNPLTGKLYRLCEHHQETTDRNR